MISPTLGLVRFTAVVASAYVVSGCAGWGPNLAPRSAALASQPASIGVSWDGNLPLVAVHIGTHGPYRFLLDTGAEATLVSARCAKDAQIDIRERELWLGGAVSSTQRSVGTGWIDKLRLGDATFSRVPVIVDEMAPGLDGILGFPVFADLLLTLDGPGRRIVLERGQLPSTAAAASCLPFRKGDAKYESPRVWGRLAGQRALILVDSGFDGFLYLARGIPDDLDLAFEPDPEQNVHMRTRLGSRDVVVGHLRDRLEIGPLELNGIATMVGMGPPVILGGAFLRGQVTTFDQKSQCLQFASRG